MDEANVGPGTTVENIDFDVVVSTGVAAGWSVLGVAEIYRLSDSIG